MEKLLKSNVLKYLIVVLAVVVIVVLVYWRGQEEESTQLNKVEFGLVDRGNYGLYGQYSVEDQKDSRFNGLSVWVFDKGDAWRGFWQKSVRLPDTGGFVDVPDVDFEKNTIVALLQGIKTTGGYYLYTEDVSFNNKKVVIKIVYKEPTDQEANTQVVTSPYDIITLPLIEGLDKMTLEVINIENNEVLLNKKIGDLLNQKVQ